MSSFVNDEVQSQEVWNNEVMVVPSNAGLLQ